MRPPKQSPIPKFSILQPARSARGSASMRRAPGAAAEAKSEDAAPPAKRARRWVHPETAARQQLLAAALMALGDTTEGTAARRLLRAGPQVRVGLAGDA